MNSALSLAEQFFSIGDGELLVGGIPVSTLAETYGTPLFVYDRQVLDKKWTALRGALPECFDIYYSVKANPNRAILQHFLSKGCGLEIASAGEFRQAIAAGCPAGKIVFAGPGKTESELELALSRGIAELHIESLLEAERTAKICRTLGIKSCVSVRVNPCGEAQGGAMRMGGKPAPFGIDEELLDEVLKTLRSETSLQLTGIHIYSGTQILDHEILLAQYRKGLEIAKRAVAILQTPLRSVDFGGGLGIPYFANDRPLDMDKLRLGVWDLMSEVAGDPRFRETRFLVEPGRYLTGEAGIYVFRINDIKVSRGTKFLITDGGMHHHLAASGNLGQTIKRNYPLALLTKLASAPEETVDVVGPLCTPLDTLARSAKLARAEVGDLLGIFQSGAYARTSSPLGFLSHPTPPEIWVDNGRHVLVRSRGSYESNHQDECLFPAAQN